MECHRHSRRGPSSSGPCGLSLRKRAGVQIAVRQTNEGNPWRTRARKTLPPRGEAREGRGVQGDVTGIGGG